MTLRYSEWPTCTDCQGKGSEEPDCKSCDGYGVVRLHHAFNMGWCLGDLEDVERDEIGRGGSCRCPVCGGGICHFCEGDGTVPPGDHERQIVRVLLAGLTGDLWPDSYFYSPGRLVRESRWYLSNAAHAELYRAEKVGSINSDMLSQWFSVLPAGQPDVIGIFDDCDNRIAIAF